MEKYMIEMTKKYPGHRDIKDYFDVGKINPIGMEPSHRTRLVHLYWVNLRYLSNVDGILMGETTVSVR